MIRSTTAFTKTSLRGYLGTGKCRGAKPLCWGSGGHPQIFKVTQRMGNQQGVRILFPPFKGDIRGLDDELIHYHIGAGNELFDVK